MQVDDFLEESSSADAFGVAKASLRMDVINDLRAGPIPGDDDLASAIALARLVHDEFESFGTDGANRLGDQGIEAAQRCLKVVLMRHDLSLELPWRDFSTFRSHWIREGCQGSWQARRDLLDELFSPIRDELDAREEKQFRAVLAEPVSPRGVTGWPAVDAELAGLRHRFRTAATPQDYRDVGNRGVAVLEALSRSVYDPAVHLRDGETEPAPDKTKLRLSRYVEDSMAGSDSAAIRAVALKTIELAQSVKHSKTPTRREAGIAADAIILLASILKRVDQDL